MTSPSTTSPDRRDISGQCERDLCEDCTGCDCGCHARRWAEIDDDDTDYDPM